MLREEPSAGTTFDLWEEYFSRAAVAMLLRNDRRRGGARSEMVVRNDRARSDRARESRCRGGGRKLPLAARSPLLQQTLEFKLGAGGSDGQGKAPFRDQRLLRALKDRLIIIV